MPQEDVYSPNELFKFKNIALDVARNFGNESDQARERMKRFVNRAAIRIAGHNRRWTWMYVTDSFDTIASTEEYSVNEDVRDLQMFWIEGANRQKLDRVPARFFRRRVPQPDIATGVPRLYDEKGVDSNGSKIFTFYPIPSGVYEIHYSYFRQLLPMRNDNDDIRSYWGMPADMLEPLTQMATALAFQGVSAARFADELALAESMIATAYGANQEKVDTIIRASANNYNSNSDGDVALPPNYGWNGL